MSRPKITPNQINASGSTAGQVLASDGTNVVLSGRRINAMTSSAPTTVSRSFSSAGDTNGVFYFLGSGYGVNPWVNPSTTAQIVAVRSENQAGTVVDIFDRATNTTYGANIAYNVYIFVDLGSGRSLVPNRYSLRNYSQPNREIRNWKLQGTNFVAGYTNADIIGATWTDLDVRVADTTMSGANAWATYVPNQSNSTSYRYLRIQQTGPDALGGEYLCVAEWELYGTLSYVSDALVDGRLVQLDGTTGDLVRQSTWSSSGGILSSTDNVTITTSQPNGSIAITPIGTGSSTINGPVILPNLTANRVILSNGTSALQTVAPSTSGNVLKSNGTTWTSAAPDVTLSANQTWTGTQTFSGTTSTLAAVFSDAAETVNLLAMTVPSTVNFDVTTSPITFYTVSTANNFVVNVRASSGTALNTALAVGQSVTIALIVVNGVTAWYNTSVQVDGTAVGVTTRWQGGTAPTTGNASSSDIYTYTVLKTAASTFSVFASQTRFA